MAHLSDLQVAALLEEIGYATRAGEPIHDAMQRIAAQRLGGVARAAKGISQRLERGESVSQALGTVQSGVSQQAAAAIRVGETSGDGRLIQRVATRLRQRSELARESRLAWFYPWLLLLVGYLVAVLVMAPLVRHMNGRDFQWADWVVQTADWLLLNWWLPPILAVVLMVVFLRWVNRRDRFPHQARLSLFCNALADQFTHDVPEDVAISAAAEISGDEDLMSVANPLLTSPEVTKVIGLPDQILSDQTLNAATDINAKQALIAQLRYLASVHGDRARRHAYLWSRFIPRCAMVLVGGGLILSFAWWVIAPVYLQVAQW